MDLTYKIVLGLHIIAGFLALLCGTISVISKKGGKVHRMSGRIFFFSMLGVCFTSVFISLVKKNQFLFFIGLFSFYLNFAGYRAIQNKSLKPEVIDWLVIALASVNAFFMLYSMNMVLMIFGTICLIVILRHLHTCFLVLRHKPLPVMAWLRMHIGMMMGAFIATATAFFVVNFNSWNVWNLPAWIAWLLPSILLLPLSFYYSGKYAAKKKFLTVKKAA